MRENAPVVRVVHIPEVSVMQLFPDRRRAVVSGYDCQPRVINLADGAELVLLDSAGVYTTPAISPDGRTIALAGDYGHVALFDADTGQRTRSLRLGTATAKMLQYLPDGERLLVVNEQASAGV